MKPPLAPNKLAAIQKIRESIETYEKAAVVEKLKQLKQRRQSS